MCSTLKLEGQSKIMPINSIILPKFIVGKDLNEKGYAWNGFARIDGAINKQKTLAQQWSSKEWKVAAVKADQFTEMHKPTGNIHTFNCSRLGVLVNNSTGDLKILTRPSKTPQEIAVHHRMPSRLPQNWTLEQYVDALNKFTGGNYNG